MPKTASLQDTFPTTIDKAGKWNNTSAAVVWDASGQAKLPCTTAYNFMATDSAAPAYDLVNSFLLAKMTLPAVGAGSRETFMEIIKDATAKEKLQFFVSGVNLTTQRILAGAASGNKSVAYNATNHAWWRISESAGTISFDFSADGKAWTNFWTTAPGFVVSSVWINFSSGYYGTETAANTFVDNVNVGALVIKRWNGSAWVPAAAIQRRTASAWVAASVKRWTGQVWQSS